MSEAPDHAILYDADCGFCMRSLSRIIRLDRRGRLRAVAIQSEEGQALLERGGVPDAARLESWHLAEPDGNVTSGGAAAVPLARLLPGGGGPAAVLAALPRPRDAAYGWVAAHRDLLGRFLVLMLAVSLTGLGVGCGTTVQEGSALTVYVSVPGAGPEAAVGEDVLAGAQQALDDATGEAGGAPIELVALDDSDGAGPTVGWSQASVAANAREATQDSTSIAYIGELDAGATLISAPITNEAGLLQLSPTELPRTMLAEPGGNDVPTDVQTTAERTLGSLGGPDAATAAEGTPGPDTKTPLFDYGYESMAVILDSIDRAEDPLSRADVVAAYLATTDRDGRTGTYTVEPDGAAAYAN